VFALNIPAWIGPLGVGSLVGTGLSLWFTARQHHKNWVNDNKKSEYRELLDTLYETVTVVSDNRPNLASINLEPINSAVKKLARIFEDRIFTADSLRKAGAFQDWPALKRVIYFQPDLESEIPREFWYSTHNLWEREDELRKKILNLATNDIVRFKFFGA
jgi:hypothetical protein